MISRRLVAGLCLAAALTSGWFGDSTAEAAPPGQAANLQRFYYYPYVYYPHNFVQGPQEYDHLYYRYPTQRRIPVYNADWYNFYPTKKPYYSGYHFHLDIF